MTDKHPVGRPEISPIFIICQCIPPKQIKSTPQYMIYRLIHFYLSQEDLARELAEGA